MASFEEMGRMLDKEVERLRAVAKEKVKPATCEKAAKVLRGVSESLSRLAEQIESKTAARKPS
jgi:hypothetical protein